MSVVVRVTSTSTPSGMDNEVDDLQPPEFLVFCKGSPEKIEAISDPNTIPVNFHSILDSYAEK